MLGVVEQLNDAEPLDIVSPDELSGYQVEFQLEQASAASSEGSAQVAPRTPSWIQTAHACDERTFVKAAAACESASYLPLQGTVSIIDGGEVLQVLEVSGEMAVHSNLLNEAQFSLNSDGAELNWVWTDDGGGTFGGVAVSGDLGLDSSAPGLGGAGGGP